MTPPRKASARPRRDAVRNAPRPRQVSVGKRGSKPSVESAWLCSAVSALPSALDSTAHTPHEKRAAEVQMNQPGMDREDEPPSASEAMHLSAKKRGGGGNRTRE